MNRVMNFHAIFIGFNKRYCTIVQRVETRMWYRLYLMLVLTSMPRTSNDVVL